MLELNGYKRKQLISILLAVLAFSLLLFSIGTDGWVRITVDREALIKLNQSELQTFLKNKLSYFSGKRGLLRTCYDIPMDEDIAQNISNLNYGGKEPCVYDAGITSWSNSDVNDAYYLMRNHLIRTTIAIFLMSVICFFIYITAGAFVLCHTKTKIKFLTTLFIFIANLLNAIGLITFSLVYFLEQKFILALDFRNSLKNNIQHSDLIKNSSINFNYSYLIGWIALCLGSLSWILYTFFSFSKSKKSKMRKTLNIPVGKIGNNPTSQGIYTWGYAGSKDGKSKRSSEKSSKSGSYKREKDVDTKN